MDLAGKVVVVAGGAGALGRPIVDALLARSARPVVLDLAIPDDLPRDVRGIAVDAQEPAAVNASLRAIEADVGPPFALVNAIGRIDSAPLVNLLAPEGERTLATGRFDAGIADNLRPVFVVGAAFAERLMVGRRPGAIVNVGSIAARGNAGQSAYAAAKAGVHALTETWARELGRFGIRVVTVAPGFIDTETMRKAVPQRVVDQIVAGTRLGRLGRPEDVAHAVIFAIENEYVTATRIDVDGGLVL